MTQLIVYSSEASIDLPLINLLHPFDVRTYKRAFHEIRKRFGPALESVTLAPKCEADSSDLLRVHTLSYLRSLTSADTLAAALGLQMVRLIPGRLLERRVVRPLRVAVQGTILAAQHALQSGFVFHIGGGFHHAFASRAEGSCLFADAAIAIRSLRARNLIKEDETVLYIDLDAHRGNGVADIFRNDPAVCVLDMFNVKAYPGPPEQPPPEGWRLIPLTPGCKDRSYLETLRKELDRFLSAAVTPGLAIYNAGTDILEGDTLGGLCISEEGVLSRDQIVIDALAQYTIPTVVLTSGGYTARSHLLIARTAEYALKRHAKLQAQCGGESHLSFNGFPLPLSANTSPRLPEEQWKAGSAPEAAGRWRRRCRRTGDSAGD
ncbi:MAG: histone deacetylase [Silvibacterium sp.]